VKILALDTATEACSAALWVDGQLIARELEFERGHAEHILPMIDGILAEGGIALSALDALAFGRGPGGFTGVRLAASVTQGLAFAANLPVVAISDLAAVAQRAFDAEPSATRMLVCNDARMKEVYWACFERDPAGLAAAVGVERVSAIDAVDIGRDWRSPPAATAEEASAAEAAASAQSSALESARAGAIGAAGRGFRAYPELRSRLIDSGSDIRLISDTFLPRAHEIARLAAPEVIAGRLLAPENAIPVYLRDDVARPQPPS
jgi:tRNA threonylcarbamoyladenosine biosynthesis protein TsaB